MRDLHSSVRVLRGIDPQAVGTTGAGNGVQSQVIDRQGFESAEWVIAMGTAGATGDTTNVIAYESDTTTTGDFTAVADADLLGTESGAGMPTATARVSGTSQNMATKLGYIGGKRYLRLRLYGLGHATGIVSAVCVLSHPNMAATTTAPG